MVQPFAPESVLFAQVSIGVAGALDVALISGTASLQLTILALALVADANCDIYLQSEDNTALFGDTSDRVRLIAGTPLVLPYCPAGWFQCKVGDDFEILGTSATFEIGGCVVYTNL